MESSLKYIYREIPVCCLSRVGANWLQSAPPLPLPFMFAGVPGVLATATYTSNADDVKTLKKVSSMTHGLSHAEGIQEMSQCFPSWDFLHSSYLPSFLLWYVLVSEKPWVKLQQSRHWRPPRAVLLKLVMCTWISPMSF